MIRTFRNAETERLYITGKSRRFQACQKVAFRRLRDLDYAGSLDDVAAIPGNRFEALKGDRQGQYSIRVNNQYRICFDWADGAAHNVEITDYH